MCGRNLGSLLVPAIAGVLIGEEVVQKQRSKPIELSVAQTVTCSTCHASVSPSFTWCPLCGQALKPHPCAYCGQIIEASDRNCQQCGAPIRAK